MELSIAALADLAFHRSKWFVPVGRTLHCFQDWTVAMAYHGAVQLIERHLANEEAVSLPFFHHLPAIALCWCFFRNVR